MLERTRLLVPMTFLMALATLVLTHGSSGLAASNSPSSLTDERQDLSFLTLFFAASETAISPGDAFSVDLIVTNSGSSPATPLVQLFVPDSISVELASLPSGVSFNFQNSSLDWLPVVPGNGGSSQARIYLTGLVADVKAPEQIFTAILKDEAEEQTVTSSIWLGVPISANIAFNPPKAAVGQPIKLVGLVDGPGPITELWSLGDGRIVEAVDPEVVFAAPGVYEIILQAANPLGPVTVINTLEVVPHPIAKFSVSDSDPMIGEPVSFTHSGGGLEPMTYSWDFGDGSISSESNPIHTFSSPGDYLVHLVIQNELGSSEAYLPVSIGQSPISDVVINEVIDAGQVLEGQAFFDQSATSMVWDMGDGQVYEGERINHVYWHSGDYLVTLRVANEFGETTIQRWVQVLPGPLLLYLPLIYSGGDSTAIGAEDNAPVAVEPSSSNFPTVLLEEIELPDGLNQAEQLFVYINEVRRLNGLGPLTYAYELSVAAQSHTNDMAINSFTGHEGSDGSSPPWRVGIAGYQGGYAGESTAWGMRRAIEPVQFWLSSPQHREIMLNPRAGEVGVGFSENYSSPNIWYWTAEFGSPGLPPVRIELPAEQESAASPPPGPPVLQLLGPPQDSAFTISADNHLIFTWQWTGSLENDQRFGLYFRASGRTIRLGSVEVADPGGQYQFSISAVNVPVSPGSHEWQVKLEEGDSSIIIAESSFWPIQLTDGNQPLPAPTIPASPSE